jgi:site-specific DNA-methyltransferase (adenine-specific)
MIFADPPFNVGKKYGKDDTKDKRDDYYEWCDQWIDEGFRVLKDTGSFCLMTIPRHLEKKFPMMGKRGVFVNLINWRNVSASHDKRRFWGSTQPILLYGKTDKYKFHQYGEVRRIPKENQRWGGYTTCAKGQLLDYWCDIPFVYSGSVKHKEAIMEPGTNSKAHPAQMPIGLPERFIKFLTDENDVVLDPFMGTGTTAIAAIKTSRQFVGFEKDKKYFTDAQKRIVEAQGQGKIGDWFE